MFAYGNFVRRLRPARSLFPLRWALCAVLLGAVGPRLHAQTGILTQHNDNGRTGAYLSEIRLTPRAVDTATGPGMRRRYEIWAGGGINAQPLYIPRLRLADKSVHNTLFIATTANTVGAWDADSGARLWNTALKDGDSASGRNVTREGVFSTPVIAGNTLYLVFNTWNGTAFPADGSDPPSSVDLQFWIAAVDIRDGHLIRQQRIAGSVPSRFPPQFTEFVAKRQVQRPALLLSPDPTRSGVSDLYIGFGSRYQEGLMNYHGWVFRYEAPTLRFKGCYCVTPDRRAFSEGGGVWQGGAGLAADTLGSVYFCTGNGDSHAGPIPWPPGALFQLPAYGNGIVKLTPTRVGSGGDQLMAVGFNAIKDDPTHAPEWKDNDIDLGSGGVILIPGAQTVVGGGKTGMLYVLKTADMKIVQKFIAANNTYISDPSQYDSNRYGDGPDPQGWGAWAMGPQLLGAPVFWQGPDSGYGFVYAWGQKDAAKSFRYYRNRPAQPVDTTQFLTGYDGAGIVRAPLTASPGGSLSLSANGTQDGILWATSPTDSGGRLLAFDAVTMRKIWEETLPSWAARFIPPTIADGRVYVALSDGRFLAYELNDPSSGSSGMLAPSAIPAILPLGNPAPRVELLLGRLGARRTALMPSNATPLFVATAMGERVYVCRQRPDGAWEWALRSTSENWIDDTGIRPNLTNQGVGQVLGRQIDEATWEMYDGSRISGERIAETPAPGSSALPWALWQRTGRVPDGSKGVFAPVTYLQRLDTQGGLPPAVADAASAGKETRAPYTALYVFYAPRKTDRE